jgi:serine phosphatase RsbU (regulator of sigma subunit)
MNMDNETFVPGNSEGLDSLDELENFREIAFHFQPSPGDIPSLNGIEICGASLPLNDVVGGDHTIYLDYKKRYDLDARIQAAISEGDEERAEKLRRCYQKAGIVVADVSGHRLTDAFISAMLHQAFLTGARYEMDKEGEITVHLFENLNTRFYKTSAVNKFITLLYGEISEGGGFRFISAAHPTPIVFSREFDQIAQISEESLVTFPPIGTIPSKVDIDLGEEDSVLGFKEGYTINEISLMGSGDIMLLFTDGLAELEVDGKTYVSGRLEEKLRETKDLSAPEICAALKNEVLSLSREDDVSLVVIKRL